MDVVSFIFELLKKVNNPVIYSLGIGITVGSLLTFAVVSYVQKGQKDREIVKLKEEHLATDRDNFMKYEEDINRRNQDERDKNNIIDSLREENFKLKEDKHRLIIENMDLKRNRAIIDDPDSS